MTTTLNIYWVRDLSKQHAYESFIICAETETEACFTHPINNKFWSSNTNLSWVCVQNVGKLNVTLLGTASPSLKKGVVMTSNN